MNKPTIVDRKELSKEINKKYIEMGELLWNNSIDERIFTDKFLEIYEEIQNKVFLLLSSSEKLDKDKVEENIEKIFQDAFRKAIESIIKINSINTQNLDFSIFKSKWMLRLRWWKSKIEFKQWDKYNEFLRIYNELFFWRKDVQIKTYMEKLDSNKIRKSPYYIINIIWGDFSKTLLISNQIWEATFVYNWMIESGKFAEIEKWQEINGLKPIKVVYSEDYSNELKDLITKKELYSYEGAEISDEDLQLKEEDYFNKLYLKTVLSSITNNEWNKIEVDLKKIWLREFSKKFSFWNGTIFWKVHWKTLLRNNWWENNIALKKILEIVWIERKDLQTEIVDYKDKKQLKEILKIATDKDWNNSETDFKIIHVTQFSKLYFGYGTKYGITTGRTILSNNWWPTNIALRKVLKIMWVERNDLPKNDINFWNNEHITEILKHITNKDWNKIDVDLKTVSVDDFSRLYFWYWTRFWRIYWKTLLRNNWWENRKSLEKIIEKK